MLLRRRFHLRQPPPSKALWRSGKHNGGQVAKRGYFLIARPRGSEGRRSTLATPGLEDAIPLGLGRGVASAWKAGSVGGWRC